MVTAKEALEQALQHAQGASAAVGSVPTPALAAQHAEACRAWSAYAVAASALEADALMDLEG